MTQPESPPLAAVKEVMQALDPLSSEERERVLQSAAALYRIGLEPQAIGAPPSPADASTSDGAGSGTGTGSGGKPTSLVEFLREKDPATNAQRIAAFAYYREHIEEKGGRFARADLLGYFASAKLAEPTKYNRDWDTAVDKGWIHDAGAQSYLTQSGEEKVKGGFGGKGEPRGSSVKKAKRGQASGE